jgi:hypothetical protein
LETFHHPFLLALMPLSTSAEQLSCLSPHAACVGLEYPASSLVGFSSFLGPWPNIDALALRRSRTPSRAQPIIPTDRWYDNYRSSWQLRPSPFPPLPRLVCFSPYKVSACSRRIIGQWSRSSRLSKGAQPAGPRQLAQKSAEHEFNFHRSSALNEKGFKPRPASS